MAQVTENTTPNRVYAILSVIGGGIMLGSAFLPQSVGQKTLNINDASNLVILSQWDVISRAAFGAPLWNVQTLSYGRSQPAIIPALILATPFLMAVLIVVLGVWALLRRPSPLLRGLFAAAVSLIALSSVDYFRENIATAARQSQYTESTGAVSAGVLNLNLGLVGLGFVTLCLGLFLTIAATYAMSLTSRR